MIQWIDLYPSSPASLFQISIKHMLYYMYVYIYTDVIFLSQLKYMYNSNSVDISNSVEFKQIMEI